MLTVKQKIIALLAEAYDLSGELTIDGLTLEDVELHDADAEDAFEDMRSAINTAMEKVNYYADGEGC
jgi:hypothetical protein